MNTKQQKQTQPQNQHQQQAQQQVFSFQAFKEILEEIDRQNHEVTTKQFRQSQGLNSSQNLTEQKSQNLFQLQKQPSIISRNIEQVKINQDSTDYNNSANFKTFMETVSTFDKGFKITETTSANQIAATYMKLSVVDLPLIIDAINNNTDLLRLFFGCKALRKILSTGNECTIKEVIDNYSSLGKRLVHLMMMPQNKELQIEILWILVNLTCLKDNHKIQDLIEFGLFEALLQMIDEDLELVERTELALQVICNSIADQDTSKQELMSIEQVKGQQRLNIKDKIDLIMDLVDKRLSKLPMSLPVYEELLLQISIFLESYMHSYKILSKKQFRWIILSGFRVLLHPCSEKIIDTLLICLKCGCANNEYASHIAYKHSRRQEICQKLVALCQNIETYQIAYNSLQIIAYLTSSDHFQESILVTSANSFQAFTNIFTQQPASQLPAQFLQSVIWTISNLIADDSNCQLTLLSSYRSLIILSLQVGMQSQTLKVVRESQVLLDNILDVSQCAQYLFIQEEVYLSIIENISFPLNFQDFGIQLSALKSLKRLIEMNLPVVKQAIVSPIYEQKTLKALIRLQYSSYQEIFDYTSYILKKYLSDDTDNNEYFSFDSNANALTMNSFEISGLAKSKTMSNIQKSFANLATQQDYMIMQVDEE